MKAAGLGFFVLDVDVAVSTEIALPRYVDPKIRPTTSTRSIVRMMVNVRSEPFFRRPRQRRRNETWKAPIALSVSLRCDKSSGTDFYAAPSLGNLWIVFMSCR